MTAQLPPGATTLSRPRRIWAAVAATLVLGGAASGCVTVHGATAVVPAATRPAAAKALSKFVRQTNEANTELATGPAAAVETGALGVIDAAGITGRHAADPKGDPASPPLKLSDTRLLIPRMAGWPKWFVVDTAQNRDSRRWLLVFTHDSAAAPWQASYLAALDASRVPALATGPNGGPIPVPAGAGGLAVAPGRLSARYAGYLQDGDRGKPLFAAGTYTSGVRDRRRTGYVPTSELIPQFADEAADERRFPPVALRLRDGGALVFFAAQYQLKETAPDGGLSVGNPAVAAVLSGTVRTSLTQYLLSEQAAVVPPASRTARVSLLAYNEGLFAARGQ